MKQALVTGGAHEMGIGYATALTLLEQGYRVVVTGVSEQEVTSTPPREGLTSRLLDVSDDAAVKDLIDGLNRLDAVVNCAGMSIPPIPPSNGEFDIDSFAKTIDINLTGTMRVSMAARSLLSESKGAIVNIASIYAIFGSDIVPGYSASKGGVVQLTKSLARSFAPDGIRVNAIGPGFIKTGMARPLWETEEISAPIVARTPMGRWGQPSELAEVIAFLCSQKAGFVTGIFIPVDGGYSIVG